MKATHTGLDRANLALVAGHAIKPTDQKYNSFLSYQSGSLPDVWYCLKSLKFKPTSDRDLRFLESILPGFLNTIDPDKLHSIPVSAMLKYREFTKDYPIEGTYDLSYLLSPRMLASVLVVNDGRRSINPNVLRFASLVNWSKAIPLLKMGSKIYRVNNAPSLIKDEVIESYKITRLPRKEGKAIDTFSVHKYIPDTNESLDYLKGDRSNAYVFSTSRIDLRIEPIDQRGYAIANIFLVRKDNHTKEKIGSIRNMRGKIFFHSPTFLVSDADRDNLDRVTNQKQLTKIQFDARQTEIRDSLASIKETIDRLTLTLKFGDSRDLRNKIASLESKRDRLAGKIQNAIRAKQDPTDLIKQARSIDSEIKDLQKDSKTLGSIKSSVCVAGQILELKRQRELLEVERRKLETKIPDMRSSFHKLDTVLIPSVIALFSKLGLNPNTALCSLPRDSILGSIKFWHSMGIETSQKDPTSPILFVRDIRKGST